MSNKHYRLNFEISLWLPKESVWSRQANGNWKSEAGHLVGPNYWFHTLLEQESTCPSHITGDSDCILTEVEEKKTWVEVKNG